MVTHLESLGIRVMVSAWPFTLKDGARASANMSDPSQKLAVHDSTGAAGENARRSACLNKLEDMCRGMQCTLPPPHVYTSAPFGRWCSSKCYTDAIPPPQY